MRVRTVTDGPPLCDLVGAGWRDLIRCGMLSLLHGLAIAAFGAGLLLLAKHQRFWLLAGASPASGGGARAGDQACTR